MLLRDGAANRLVHGTPPSADCAPLLPAVAESCYPVVGAIVQMCYELIGSVQTGTVTGATMQEKIRVLQAEALGCGDKALLQAIVNAFWAVC